jgi:elongation factor G
MDRERADFFKIFDHIKEQFSTIFVPITIPMGSGEDFKGVINLIEKTSVFF